MIQHEIESSTPVLSGDGDPSTFGWARRPLFLYAPSVPAMPAGNVSESDMYIIFSTTHLFAFELANAGWTRYMLLTALSIRERRVFTKVIPLSGALGAFMLPPGSEAGSARITQGAASVHFIVMDHGNRIIKIDIPHFDRENTLRGEVALIAPPDAQSIVTNLPWPKEKGRFQHTRCSPWYRVEGVMQFENKDVVFLGGRSWGIFLWNRAMRPGQDVHFWASACGKDAGRQIGFSVGYGTAATDRATENAFFINGKLYKLAHVTFKIPPSSWTDAWTFSSSDGRLHMRFSPMETSVQRHAGILRLCSVRRVYGVYSGRFLLDDGQCVAFNNITGIAERKKTRK